MKVYDDYNNGVERSVCFLPNPQRTRRPHWCDRIAQQVSTPAQIFIERMFGVCTWCRGAVFNLMTRLGRLQQVVGDATPGIESSPCPYLRARGVLKHYRRNGHAMDGVDDPDILSCSKEENRKLRRLYTKLFASSRDRTALCHHLNRLMVHLKLTVHAQYNQTSKMTECREKRKTFNRLILNNLPNLLREVFSVLGMSESKPYNENNTTGQVNPTMYHPPLTSLMQQLDYSSNQQASSTHILKRMVEENIELGLSRAMTFFLDPEEYDNNVAWINEELETLMSQGLSFWEAVDTSERIESFLVESLRFRPVLNRIDRSDSNPADSMENVEIYDLSRRPELVGDEPNEFRKERYLTDRRPHWPSHKFLPFGYGPHQCPAWFLYKATATRFLGMLATLFENDAR